MKIELYGESLKREEIEKCKKSLKRGELVRARARSYVGAKLAEVEKKKLH